MKIVSIGELLAREVAAMIDRADGNPRIYAEAGKLADMLRAKTKHLKGNVTVLTSSHCGCCNTSVADAAVAQMRLMGNKDPILAIPHNSHLHGYGWKLYGEIDSESLKHKLLEISIDVSKSASTTNRPDQP